MPEDLRHRVQRLLVVAHLARLRQFAEQVQCVGVGILFDVAVLHFDGIDFRVRAQLHEDQ